MHRARLALGVALVVAASGVGAAVLLRPREYDVVSIRENQSFRDAQMLERAWALPVAHTYGREALQFQPTASFCGPTSMANVLVSLGLDPAATPKTAVDGTGYCWIGQCIGGLTLEQMASIAEHHSLSATVLRDLDLEAFREHMRRSNDLDRRYVINFSRGPLFGKGGGHHSPIGGYFEQEDLVFVLDVNADFQPWLVETERLHAAIDTIDPATDRTRGLLLLEPNI